MVCFLSLRFLLKLIIYVIKRKYIIYLVQIYHTNIRSEYFMSIFDFVGICRCKENFHGNDCGLDIRVPPQIAGIPDMGLCDLKQRECAKTSVLGYGFVETPALACQTTPFMVI